jgi:hypothetical protein
MSSTSNRNLLYLKERCINAYWMVRTGKFKLIFKSIFVEIGHRVVQFQSWRQSPNDVDESQIPGSAYFSKRKVLPASYRPTQSCLQTLAPLQIENQAVADELQQILSTFQFSSNSDS